MDTNVTLRSLMIIANETAQNKGFWEYYDDIDKLPYQYTNDEGINKNIDEHQKWQKEQHLCTKIALVITELSEAIEARRKGKFTSISSSYKQILSEESTNTITDIDAHNKLIQETFEKDVKDTYEDELADAAIRLFDLAEKTNVDLVWHIQQKMAYNETRSKMHGKKY